MAIVVMLLFLSFSAHKETVSQLSFPEISMEGTPYLSLPHCLPYHPFWEWFPKRDNRIISLLIRLHRPPRAAVSAEPQSSGTHLLCTNKIMVTSRDQGVQWALCLPCQELVSSLTRCWYT